MEIKYSKLAAQPDGRWSVIFEDAAANGYKIGLYSPEFSKQEEIDKLEKHSGPEIFLLVQGSMSLIIRDLAGHAESEEVVALQAGEALVVYGFHNGFTPDQGIAFVVEDNNLHTDFIAYSRDQRQL